MDKVVVQWEVSLQVSDYENTEDCRSDLAQARVQLRKELRSIGDFEFEVKDIKLEDDSDPEVFYFLGTVEIADYQEFFTAAMEKIVG